MGHTYTKGVSPSFNPFGAQYERRTINSDNLPTLVPEYNAAQDFITILEAWVFRRADTLRNDIKSWAKVTRNLLPMSDSEMEIVVRESGKKGKSIWESFALLSTYQQRQIHLLFREKQDQDTRNRFIWTLKAIKTDPKRAKTVGIRSIQAILERRVKFGAQDRESLSRHVNSTLEFTHGITKAPSFERQRIFSHVRHDRQHSPSFGNVPSRTSKARPSKVSFASEPNRRGWDDHSTEDSFESLSDTIEISRRSDTHSNRSDAKHSRSSKTYGHPSLSSKSKSKPSHSNQPSTGPSHQNWDRRVESLRLEAKRGREIDILESSVADLAYDVDDISRKVAIKFDRLDKKLALRPSEETAVDSSQIAKRREAKHEAEKIRNVSGPYYSEKAFTALKPQLSQPPSPSPTITIDDLLSKWTIMSGGHQDDKHGTEKNTEKPADDKEARHTLGSLPQRREQTQQRRSQQGQSTRNDPNSSRQSSDEDSADGHSLVDSMD